MKRGNSRCLAADVMRRLLDTLFMVILVSCGQGQQWNDATGARRVSSVGRWFEDNWIGSPWGTVTLQSSEGDSVHGFSRDGTVHIRGSIVRHRIDAEIRRNDSSDLWTGYLYLVPDTDTLFVGVRGRDGSWEQFFTMVREKSVRGS